MGDTPINLNSPEQMSWVIYSRKPKDKTTWTHNFDSYMKTYQTIRRQLSRHQMFCTKLLQLNVKLVLD